MLHYKSLAELEQSLNHITQAPKDLGRVELIVCRPEPGQRAVLAEARLSPAEGLAGDSWKRRGYRKRPDGSVHPGCLKFAWQP